MRSIFLVGILALGGCGGSPIAPSAGLPAAPEPTIFRREGVGAAEFLLPPEVSLVRITGRAQANSCHDFAVYIASRMAAHTIIGSCSIASGMTFEGEYRPLGRDVVVHRVDPDNNVTPFSWVIEEIR